MNVLEIVIRIEKERNLFSYKNVKRLPLWDILRYDVIKVIDSKINPQSKALEKSGKKLYIKILHNSIRDAWLMLKLLFIKKHRILVHSSPRNRDKEGFYFDKITYDLIKTLGGRCVVTETGFNSPMLYKTFPLPETLYCLFYSKVCRKHVDNGFAQELINIFNNEFEQIVLTKEELDKIYTRFSALSSLLYFVVKLVNPDYIITSDGRYKSMMWAAKKHNVKAYLMQHGLIEERDHALCGTCPSRDKGLYPDGLLTFGTYWGGYMKHLCDVYPIGNNFMYTKSTPCDKNDMVMFISSIYQGKYISVLAKEFAEKNPTTPIIYKLHNAEIPSKEKYCHYFSGNDNVQVYSTEEDLHDLITRSKLVVLISSTVFYETLSQKRCVALWDHPDFTELTRMHKGFKNSHVFKNVEQLTQIAENSQFIEDGTTFFEPYHEDVAKKLFF